MNQICRVMPAGMVNEEPPSSGTSASATGTRSLVSVQITSDKCRSDACELSGKSLIRRRTVIARPVEFEKLTAPEQLSSGSRKV